MPHFSTFAAIVIALLASAACPAAAETPSKEQQSPADVSVKEMFETWDKAVKKDAPAGETNAAAPASPGRPADKEHEEKLQQCISDCEKEKPEDRPMCVEGCNGQDFN